MVVEWRVGGMTFWSDVNGVLTYVGRAYKQRHETQTHLLRELMLNATFVSVSQRFPRVILATCTQQDAAVSERIPFWRTLVQETDKDDVGDCAHLYPWSYLKIRSSIEWPPGYHFRPARLQMVGG